MSTRRLTAPCIMLLIPLALCSLLAGCGQKGDLYLPDKNQATLAHPPVAGPAGAATQTRRS